MVILIYLFSTFSTIILFSKNSVLYDYKSSQMTPGTTSMSKSVMSLNLQSWRTEDYLTNSFKSSPLAETSSLEDSAVEHAFFSLSSFKMSCLVVFMSQLTCIQGCDLISDIVGLFSRCS